MNFCARDGEEKKGGRKIASQAKKKNKNKKRLRSASFEPSLSKSNSRGTQLELISRFARSNSDACVFRIIISIHFFENNSPLGWGGIENSWKGKGERKKRRVTEFTVGKKMFTDVPSTDPPFTLLPIHIYPFVYRGPTIRRRIKEIGIGNRLARDLRFPTGNGIRKTWLRNCLISFRIFLGTEISIWLVGLGEKVRREKRDREREKGRTWNSGKNPRHGDEWLLVNEPIIRIRTDRVDRSARWSLSHEGRQSSLSLLSTFSLNDSPQSVDLFELTDGNYIYIYIENWE